MQIHEIKQQVIKQVGGDPFTDPTSWDLIGRRIPEKLWPLLIDRSGAAEFVNKLSSLFEADKLGPDQEAQVCWERIGNYYKNQRRYHEALPIYSALYTQFLIAQKKTDTRLHKGAPLVWISDCYSALGFPVLAKRYLMLTLCEDAIREAGRVSPNTTGTYFRLVWGSGLPHSELVRYASRIEELCQNNPIKALYPEWILQELDQNWMTEFPSPQESAVYCANQLYIQHLISELGEPTGRVLECLAGYILSCMPGCRTTQRRRTLSTDYDIVCSMEGLEVDFRSELGRYFVCECKDWDSPADFGTMAKFCRVLDSTKSRFGILFSKKGISGQDKTRYADREQLKIFQDRGMVIVVVNQEELESVANGGNFINLLRTKYEMVRLDLTHSKEKQRQLSG